MKLSKLNLLLVMGRNGGRYADACGQKRRELQLVAKKYMNKKVGILTFHYVTNYGAVLQCYALQSFLNNMGYETEVINYKPMRNEDNVYNFFRFRKFKDLSSYLLTRRREQQLEKFRGERLRMGARKLRTMAEVQRYVKDFDVLISGSDQVLNPSSLLYGEAYGGKGSPCPVYFLGFPFPGRKIGYALSCGDTEYPEPQLTLARKHIHSFDKISVRENSGVDIIRTMGREDAVVVPDPTLLQEAQLYHQLADSAECSPGGSYIYSFFLRDIRCMREKIDSLPVGKQVLWNNEDGDYSLEGWLKKIKQADFVITDSFHCMVMCLKLHTPFAIITKLEGMVGMNDRFYTLLEYLGMEECIVYKERAYDIIKLLQSAAGGIAWEQVDRKLAEYSQVGAQYLSEL